jgi:hypothetical protein
MQVHSVRWKMQRKHGFLIQIIRSTRESDFDVFNKVRKGAEDRGRDSLLGSPLISREQKVGSAMQSGDAEWRCRVAMQSGDAEGR